MVVQAQTCGFAGTLHSSRGAPRPGRWKLAGVRARPSVASVRCLGRSGCFADPAAVCRAAAWVGGHAVLASQAAFFASQAGRAASASARVPRPPPRRRRQAQPSTLRAGPTPPAAPADRGPRRRPLLHLQPAQRCRWPASRSTRARSHRTERNLDAFASTLVPLIDAVPSRSSPASRASSSTCRNAVPPKRAGLAAEMAALLVRCKAAIVSWSGCRLAETKRTATSRQVARPTRRDENKPWAWQWIGKASIRRG